MTASSNSLAGSSAQGTLPHLRLGVSGPAGVRCNARALNNTGQESARRPPPDPISPEVRRYLDDLVPDRPAELARMEEHARSSPAGTRRERNARDAGCGDRGPDFVRAAVRRNVESGGYLHIGHVKAICVNFGVAAEFGGSSRP